VVNWILSDESYRWTPSISCPCTVARFERPELCRALLVTHFGKHQKKIYSISSHSPRRLEISLWKLQNSYGDTASVSSCTLTPSPYKGGQASEMSSTPKSTPPKSSGKMTRAAVVANLNRQRAASQDGQQQAAPANRLPSYHTENMAPTLCPSTSPSRAQNNTATPLKSLPPKPSSALRKELPDVPEFFVVRPPPKSSSVKVERNDRRVFMNRDTLEKIKVSNGSVVVIQRHYAPKYVPLGGSTSDDLSDEEEDKRMTVGIACPMSQIQPNGMSSHP
jgi:hypothetical protein